MLLPTRFTVRDFSLEEAEQQRQEMNRLSVDKKEQYVSNTGNVQRSNSQ